MTNYPQLLRRWIAQRPVQVVINIIVFQIGWFSAVLGGAHDKAWLGSSVVAIIVVVHVLRAVRATQEVILILLTTLIGTLWDSALVTAGVIQYPHGTVISGMAPIWIIAVWALFATAFNTTLMFLRRRYLVAILFGAVGAPLSFAAGARLGALQFPNQTTALLVIGAGWAVLMPPLIVLAQIFNGMEIQTGSTTTKEADAH